MSLLDRAADAAADQIDEHAADWLTKGLGEARKLADRGGLALREAVLVEDVLNAAERHAPGLADVGRERLLAAIMWTGFGEKNLAHRAWLADGSGTGATFAERRAASAASTARTAEATERREAAWEAFQKFAAEVGQTALRVALPLLLAAL